MNLIWILGSNNENNRLDGKIIYNVDDADINIDDNVGCSDIYNMQLKSWDKFGISQKIKWNNIKF